MMIENNTQSLYYFHHTTAQQNIKNDGNPSPEVLPSTQSLQTQNALDTQVNVLSRNGLSSVSTNDIMNLHSKLDNNKDINNISKQTAKESYTQPQVESSSGSSAMDNKLEELYEKLAEIQKKISALMTKLQNASDEQKMILNEQLNALNTQMATILSQIMAILKSQET